MGEKGTCFWSKMIFLGFLLCTTSKYIIKSKSEVSKYFKQHLADHRFSGTPSPVETVRTDDAAEFKSGYFADLCRERGIRQEFTTANSPPFNGVAQKGELL